jgi:hypothetical protein
MELKKVPTWKIKESEFDMDRVLINLEILENGPVSFQEYFVETNIKKRNNIRTLHYNDRIVKYKYLLH